MAKRKGYGRRRGGSGGVMALLKPFLVGALAGKFGSSLPVINQLPTGGAGAVGGYLMKRDLMGAAAGAAGQIVGTPLLNNVLGGSTSGGSVSW